MFTLICPWINDWVNNCEAGELRRLCAHCVVTVVFHEKGFQLPATSHCWKDRKSKTYFHNSSNRFNTYIRHRLIHRSPVNSLHKGQWRGAFMFSLICAWINGWVNNRKASDLRRHHAHYDVIVMIVTIKSTGHRWWQEHDYTLHSTKLLGVYWFHSGRLSARLSVPHPVSAL